MTVTVQSIERLDREFHRVITQSTIIKTPGTDYAGLQVPLWLLAFLLPPIVLATRGIMPTVLIAAALVLVSVSLITTLTKVITWVRMPQELHLASGRLVIDTRAGVREIRAEDILSVQWRPGASTMLSRLYGGLAVTLLLLGSFIMGGGDAIDPRVRLFWGGMMVMGVASGIASLLLSRLGPTRELVLETHHAPEGPVVLVMREADEALMSRWLGPDTSAMVALSGTETQQARPAIEPGPWIAMVVPMLLGLLAGLF